MSYRIIDQVIEYWNKNDVAHLPGVSAEQIDTFEAAFGVRLPDDFRAFFQTTNGTHVPLAAGQDQDSYDFWPLDQVVPDSRFPWAMNFLDYREMSWWFAIDLTGGGGFGIGAVYLMGAIGWTPIIVARSFGAFLALYVNSDDRLYPEGARVLERSNREGEL